MGAPGGPDPGRWPRGEGSARSPQHAFARRGWGAARPGEGPGRRMAATQNGRAKERPQHRIALRRLPAGSWQCLPHPSPPGAQPEPLWPSCGPVPKERWHRCAPAPVALGPVASLPSRSQPRYGLEAELLEAGAKSPGKAALGLDPADACVAPGRTQPTCWRKQQHRKAWSFAARRCLSQVFIAFLLNFQIALQQSTDTLDLKNKSQPAVKAGAL